MLQLVKSRASSPTFMTWGPALLLLQVAKGGRKSLLHPCYHITDEGGRVSPPAFMPSGLAHLCLARRVSCIALVQGLLSQVLHSDRVKTSSPTAINSKGQGKGGISLPGPLHSIADKGCRQISLKCSWDWITCAPWISLNRKQWLPGDKE